ncbi:collagen-like protein [Mesorhizobium sp. B2-3-4]|uniref:collagen-like protein n=1 Tax=Mesorhizobium sp. B2-3-4 TaxID=2589959 RepID=UPI0015E302B9|nr:collagen-like protein [Mesorhizobium sp. B2-3-4]
MKKQAARTMTISETSMPASLRSFIEAASDTVAREIAELRRQALAERELRNAQFSARMSELETRIASVAEIERRLAERITTLKDGEPGKDGERGEPGERGGPGPQGERGEPGPPGADGRDGVDGQAGEPGERGESGPQGERGEPGPSGADGRDGVDGQVGEPGERGPQGERGEPGQPGADGHDGVDGQTGERGAEGPAGSLPIVAEWEDRVYYQGEVVTRDGSIFQAVRDTGKQPGHDHWRCIVAAGSNGMDGQDGRSFTIRGTFLEINDYREMDVVALGGASFAAKRDNPGICPGDGWQLIASQGKRGSPGEAGSPGPKGERGDAAQAVVSITVDDEGLQTLISGDGSKVQCDLYPVLARLKQ